MSLIKTIAFDADDTLWECETLFQASKARICEVLNKYASEEELKEKIFDQHIANLDLYGYGIKGYVLSVIETALDISNRCITSDELGTIIAIGKEMLHAPVILLEGVKEVLESLSGKYQLLLITKGDLLDQQRKLEQSGLSHLFDGVEVVSEKNEACYREIFSRRNLDLKTTIMVGNSLKSDVLPVVAIGGIGVHVPYAITWEHERVNTVDYNLPHLYKIESLQELHQVVKRYNKVAEVVIS